MLLGMRQIWRSTVATRPRGALYSLSCSCSTLERCCAVCNGLKMSHVGSTVSGGLNSRLTGEQQRAAELQQWRRCVVATSSHATLSETYQQHFCFVMLSQLVVDTSRLIQQNAFISSATSAAAAVAAHRLHLVQVPNEFYCAPFPSHASCVFQAWIRPGLRTCIASCWCRPAVCQHLRFPTCGVWVGRSCAAFAVRCPPLMVSREPPDG
jgi:hypothetical protein